MRPWGLIAPLFLLTGCKALPVVAGLGSGAVAGSLTGSPAVGFVVGVGVDAGVDYVQRYYGRSRQHGEQEAIAAAAADVPPGGSADWKIEHTIPIDNEHGELKVVRLIDTPLASCKEIVFSVVDGHGPTAPRAWYDADICREQNRWHWASAEPAVERWGFLQ
jgi:hypothetical protein